MSSNIDRRVTTLETAMAAVPRSCPTCEEWPSFFVRFREEDGSISSSGDCGWPTVDVPTCPGCGRTCEKVITIGCDPRGPA